MRSRIAAVSREFDRSRAVRLAVVTAVVTTVLFGAGSGVAAAATMSHQAANVLEAGISAGLTGQVGVVAVLAGGAGLATGLVRRHRRSVARRRAENAADEPVKAEPAP